ncbi:MAG: hypothetical protein QOH24_367 [Verrucomicrobiota bacterium]|jgi:hypothetical protein
MDLLTQANIVCPYCGEAFPLEVDTSQKEQMLVEDCSICCRPITLIVRSEPGEIVELIVGEETT